MDTQPTRRRPSALVLVAVLATALAASGCSDDDDLTLIGPEWELRSAVVEGVQTYPGPFGGRTIVRFSRDRFHGFDGCMTFGGSIRVIGTVIEPGDQFTIPANCLIAGYHPPHFDAPFLFAVTGEVLTVTGTDSTFVYDAR